MGQHGSFQMAFEWQFRRVKNTMFVYKCGEMTPTFTFKSKDGNWPFRGHGLIFRTKLAMTEHINRNGNIMKKKASANAHSSS